MGLSCQLCLREKNQIKSVIDQACCAKMAGYRRSSLYSFMDRDEPGSNLNNKLTINYLMRNYGDRGGCYSSYYTKAEFNNCFIIHSR